MKLLVLALVALSGSMMRQRVYCPCEGPKAPSPGYGRSDCLGWKEAQTLQYRLGQECHVKQSWSLQCGEHGEHGRFDTMSSTGVPVRERGPELCWQQGKGSWQGCVSEHCEPPDSCHRGALGSREQRGGEAITLHTAAF